MASPTTFELNLLFKDYKNAIEAFGQLGKYYELLNELDKAIIRNVSPNLISEYGLEDVEYGSLRTKLSQILKAIPDDVLQSLEIKQAIGYLLVKAKYWVLKLLADEKEITSKQQLEKVTNKINGEIRTLGDKHGLMVTQINNYIILNSIDDITKETNQLKNEEALEYKSTAGNATIKKGIFLNKAKILSELGQTTITNETTEILKIKKVDLLSYEAKWDFLQGKRKLPAKILDKQWLQDYHNRNINIQPEDALMVTLKTTHSYTPSFDDKVTSYEIVKVLKVIKPEDNSNTSLPFNQ